MFCSTVASGHTILRADKVQSDAGISTMPRDMTCTGRYPPQPRYPPFAFYSAIRLGDPEMLAKIMASDPYFITQDNGAGAPLHFAVTYGMIDMVHHLLNNGAAINQGDTKGITPLHRAAAMAHIDGYLEIYELLLSRGADPALLAKEYDPYMAPGRKLPRELALPRMQPALEQLEQLYAGTPKAPQPHPDIGDWWALYDYGPEVVASWAADYQHPYPEEMMRQRRKQQQKEERRARKQALAAAIASMEAGGLREPFTGLPQEQGAPGGSASAGSSSSASGALALAGQGSATQGFGAGSSPVAFLFPGQGSQALAMISPEVAALPVVSQMLSAAQRVLGYDLLELVTTGPKPKLDDTVYSQPALYVANLAAVEVARQQHPAAVAGCRAAAGLSLGEYSALVFAGAMSFEDGLKVVKVRGEAMAAAAAAGGRRHGMLSVVGLSDELLEQLAARACQELGGGTMCQLANYLFPTGRVVSGHLDALEVVRSAAMEAGAVRAVLLAVSGAFHTRLMEPARTALLQVLDSVDIRAPLIPVYSNVTGQPMPYDPAAIRELLGRQLVEPVRWEATLAALLSPGGVGASRLFELGPGAQIKSMVRRINQEAWKEFTNINAQTLQ